MIRFALAGTAALILAGSAAAQAVTVPLQPSAVETKAVSVDDAVPDRSGVRRSILLGGLDKITARIVQFEAPVGVPVRYQKLMITAHMCYTRPPEETPETSAFIDVDQIADDGSATQRLFSGWMFASSPALNALEHPVYDVWVISCNIVDPNAPVVAAATAPVEGEMTTAPTLSVPVPVAKPGEAGEPEEETSGAPLD